VLVEEKKVSTKAAKVKNELSKLRDRLQIAIFLRWLSINGNYGRAGVAQSLHQSSELLCTYQQSDRVTGDFSSCHCTWTNLKGIAKFPAGRHLTRFSAVPPRQETSFGCCVAKFKKIQGGFDCRGRYEKRGFLIYLP
jgi:hypothetical protein